MRRIKPVEDRDLDDQDSTKRQERSIEAMNREKDKLKQSP